MGQREVLAVPSFSVLSRRGWFILLVESIELIPAKRLANRLKLKTWVYLRLRLAWPLVYLRWLALTLIEIKFARKSTQVFYCSATDPKPIGTLHIYDGDGKGLRLAKNVFLFYFGISHLFGSITLSVLKFVHECVQFQKLAVVVLVLETTQNLVISRCCFAEDGKVCTKNFNARARPLFWSSNPLFGDVLRCRCFALGP